MAKRLSFTSGGALVAAAVLVSSYATVTAAGTAITGTVKVTGAASNADAVVYIQNAAGVFPPARVVTMDQSKMQFTPHVLPVTAGATVKFLNGDPTAHNVFSPDNEKFNLGTWPQGQTKEYTFNKCAKFPCVYTLLCRVHPEMEGFVVVLQNPFFAVSGKDGHYTIEGVPPGSYTLALWHAKGKAQPKPLTVAADKPATADFVLRR
ncbi:MAG TPA: carboxypeptidase regulatory-like domain-containing protein [Vicinamibacterales bacterium]|nr:carboxypeptidase regulatory-like domain-containing protein [Vicinamibacterales bacterium]